MKRMKGFKDKIGVGLLEMLCQKQAIIKKTKHSKQYR
jgi:hypothetical protein